MAVDHIARESAATLLAEGQGFGLVNDSLTKSVSHRVRVVAPLAGLSVVVAQKGVKCRSPPILLLLLARSCPFFFVLSVVVFFHELGHFLIGRLCGVKVDTFSLGFGPELAHFTRPLGAPAGASHSCRLAAM